MKGLPIFLLLLLITIAKLLGPRGAKAVVADAFRHLNSRKDLLPQGRVSIAGFSYGAGPVLLAALEPDIRDEVDFVITLGGYFNLHTIVAYCTAGYFKTGPDGNLQYLQPSPYNKSVFTLSNGDLVERRRDRASLRTLAHESLEYGEAASAVSLANLAPNAQAFCRFITNEGPNRVPELIQQLQASIFTELEGLNPASRDLTTPHVDIWGQRDTWGQSKNSFPISTQYA
jgi:hypothetical protein